MRSRNLALRIKCTCATPPTILHVCMILRSPPNCFCSPSHLRHSITDANEVAVKNQSACLQKKTLPSGTVVTLKLDWSVLDSGIFVAILMTARGPNLACAGHAVGLRLRAHGLAVHTSVDVRRRSDHRGWLLRPLRRLWSCHRRI